MNANELRQLAQKSATGLVNRITPRLIEFLIGECCQVELQGVSGGTDVLRCGKLAFCFVAISRDTLPESVTCVCSEHLEPLVSTLHAQNAWFLVLRVEFHDNDSCIGAMGSD